MLALTFTLGTVGTALAAEDASPPGLHVSTTEVLAGAKAEVSGFRFPPGQRVTLTLEHAREGAQPVVVQGNGRFKSKVQIPHDAKVGVLQLTAKADGAEVARTDLMVSKVVPVSGADRFTVTQGKLPPGPYLAAISADGKAVFVTRSVFKKAPESGIAEAGILKVDTETLKVLDSTTPPVSPARDDGKKKPAAQSVYAAFGMAADSSNQTLWVTNVLNDTVAAYRQGDLSLLKQFEPGVVAHPHFAQVDAAHHKVYVSSVGDKNVAVIDTQTLKPLKSINIDAGEGDKKFVPLGLALDSQTGTLYVSSMEAPAIAAIDSASGKVKKVFTPLPQAREFQGLAWDAANRLLLVASRGNDNLLVVDPETGKLVHDVYVGAQPLTVAWEPVSGWAFTANRGAGTVTVVEPKSGKLLANLAVGSFPNHVVADGKGNVYVINKSKGPDDLKGDLITRITPKVR